MGTPPVKNFRYGGVSVAVWLNQSRTGVHYNVTAKRSYQDSEGAWADSESFSDYDLPALAKAVWDAHSYIQTLKASASITGGSPEETGPTDDSE